jgi:hypothetical protein
VVSKIEGKYLPLTLVSNFNVVPSSNNCLTGQISKTNAELRDGTAAHFTLLLSNELPLGRGEVYTMSQYRSRRKQIIFFVNFGVGFAIWIHFTNESDLVDVFGEVGLDP